MTKGKIIGWLIALIAAGAGFYAYVKGYFAMPKVTIASGAKGTQVNWSATGFSPNSKITVTIQGLVLYGGSEPTSTNWLGNANGYLQVGNNLSGSSPFVVTDANGKTASATFTVT